MIELAELLKTKIVMETELAKDSYTNLNFLSNYSDIPDNEFVNECVNLVNDTPTNINESIVENNQVHSLEYKTLRDKLKPIFLETIDNYLNNNSINGKMHPMKVNVKKMIANVFEKNRNTNLEIVDYAELL